MWHTQAHTTFYQLCVISLFRAFYFKFWFFSSLDRNTRLQWLPGIVLENFTRLFGFKKTRLAKYTAEKATTLQAIYQYVDLWIIFF